MTTPEGTLCSWAGALEYLVNSVSTDVVPKAGYEKAHFADLVFGTNAALGGIRLIHALLGHASASKDEVAALGKTAKEVAVCLNKSLQGGKHFLGGRLTVADLALYAILKYYFNLVFNRDMASKVFADLLAWFEATGAHEVVAKYFGVAFVCKVPFKFVEVSKSQPKKKAQPVKEEPKKDEKKKHPCDLLPPAKLNLEDFKRVLMNGDKKTELTKAFDLVADGSYSFWFFHYDKLDDECKQHTPTKNLTSMFIQKCDPARKYALAAHGMYGEEGNYDLFGVWMVRGDDIKQVMDFHSSFEYYKVTKLNPSNEADRQRIFDYMCNVNEGDEVEGRKVSYAKYFL